jgi:hypothetical protein
MTKPRGRTRKKKKTYETLRIETEVKRQLALACPKAYTYSEFLRRLLSGQKIKEKIDEIKTTIEDDYENEREEAATTD